MDDRTSRPPLPDAEARRTALTAIDRSLLVEAGAGSGKTSILAGRIAVLLASGIKPKHVAAISFTEFSASELLIRVDRFVSELTAGTVRKELEIAFPEGVSLEQRKNLTDANATFDQLTCSTIHGFAQALIKPYPAEANIDPGASIVDPAEADLAFTEHFDAWMREHLSEDPDDDIIAELVLVDEKASIKLISEIATFLKTNRDAHLADGHWLKAAVHNFTHAVETFRHELHELTFRETTTDERLKGYAEIGAALSELDLAHDHPPARAMIGVVNLPKPEACFTQNGSRRSLRAKSKWEAEAKAAGRPKSDGTNAHEIADGHCETCHTAYEALVAVAAAELLSRLVGSMQGLMLQWSDYKRAAALLDFDDLLYKARDLLAQHEQVRQALAERFQYVLVDEFQDTDPLQIEILWHLCGDPAVDDNLHPLSRKLRPGALFLVGDPKQAIYRFRGADVNAYVAAREAISRKALLEITANFRSRKSILDFVNERFAVPLAKEQGQPGFSALASTVPALKNTASVAALDVVTDDEKPKADLLRNAEATQVAELCRRLIGNWVVRDPDTEKTRPCQAGDIALLAPVGTELWRFEEALEDQGIPVSTQAGKGFFNRQEIQDLIALTRTIADGRDTLALGALLRGPLIGLTETELLDIAEGLPIRPESDSLPHLHLWTDPQHIKHDLARQSLEKLQALARRARWTTPYILLADAIDTLAVRPHLQQRFKTGSGRAIANVDLFLELAHAYDVRGLRAFARDMRANWEDATRQIEGRPDAAYQSVTLITIHAAKGLEWPIVIPINATGSPIPETGIISNRQEEKFSTRLLNVTPPAYTAIKTWNDEEQTRERVRLWYVAMTRARDLLILPRHSAALKDSSWAKVVDLDLPALPGFDLTHLPDTPLKTPIEPENQQTRAIFAEEAKRIAACERKINWVQPSRGELEATEGIFEVPIYTDPEAFDESAIGKDVEVAGSTTRGRILHKLMEEILTGETKDDVASLVDRASELLAQLGIQPAAEPSVGIAPKELAETIIRTLGLPEIEKIRPNLSPEIHVYSCDTKDNQETLISGISDAIAIAPDGTVEAVVDWKSDVELPAGKLHIYRNQIEAYCKSTGAARGLLVLMSSGKVINAG